MVIADTKCRVLLMKCYVLFIRYDKKDTSKISLVDLQFICALGPPGGGRNPVTPRFVRHFNIISVAKFNDDTMTRIFSSIVSFYFKVWPMNLLIFAGSAQYTSCNDCVSTIWWVKKTAAIIILGTSKRLM